MLNLNTWNLFTLPLNGGAAETAPDDLRLLAAVGDEARNDYLRGVSAIGNLVFWALTVSASTFMSNPAPARRLRPTPLPVSTVRRIRLN